MKLKNLLRQLKDKYVRYMITIASDKDTYDKETANLTREIINDLNEVIKTCEDRKRY